MRVTSTKNVSFPKLDWGINKGDVRELPPDKEAQKIILAHPAISEVKEAKSKEDKTISN